MSFLIASRWLRGEAAARGLSASRGDVHRRITELQAAVPGGASAFAETLKSSGQSIADIEAEVEAELDATAIRDQVGAPHPVSARSVAQYYKRFPERFRTPESRSFDIVENLRTAGAARSLAAHIGAGARFSRRAYHESFARPTRFEDSEKGRLLRAIFSAPIGVLEEPMRLNRAWTVFVVRRVRTSGIRPLAAERAAIAKQLSAAARARAIAQFESAYWRKWRAITNCRSGFVVSQCLQYRGRIVTGSALTGLQD